MNVATDMPIAPVTVASPELGGLAKAASQAAGTSGEARGHRDDLYELRRIVDRQIEPIPLRTA